MQVVKTKRWEVETERGIKEVLNFQILKGLDNPQGKEKKEIKETELIIDQFINYPSIVLKTLYKDEEISILKTVDKVLKESFITLIINENGERKAIIIKESKDEKVIKKIKGKLLLHTENEELVDKVLQKYQEVVEKENEVGDGEIPLNGALINENYIIPYADINLKGTIKAFNNPQLVEEINKKIAETLDDEEVEKLKKERDKLYQPLLELAMSTSDRGDYFKQNTLAGLERSLKTATDIEKKEIILLIPLFVVGGEKLTYTRIAIRSSNSVNTSIVRRFLATYRNILIQMKSKKFDTAYDLAKKTSISRRLEMVIDYFKRNYNSELIQENLREIEKAINIIDSILFPQQVLNPYFIDIEIENGEELKELSAILRDMENKAYDVLKEYYPQLYILANALLKAINKLKIKIKTEEGIEEKVLKLEDLKVRDKTTIQIITKINEALKRREKGIDFEEIFNRLDKIKAKFKGKTIDLEYSKMYLIVNYLGEILRDIISKPNPEIIGKLTELKEWIDNYVETGRKTFRKPIEVEVEGLDFLLEEEEEKEIETPKKVENSETSEEIEDLDKILFGDEGEEGENTDDIIDLL